MYVIVKSWKFWVSNSIVFADTGVHSVHSNPDGPRDDVTRYDRASTDLVIAQNFKVLRMFSIAFCELYINRLSGNDSR